MTKYCTSANVLNSSVGHKKLMLARLQCQNGAVLSNCNFGRGFFEG
ncbi:hypothetical protein [Candidatus Methanomassiliicoccus intestinalis]|nr:hypothetical protein [Candidatus Methanomassiliicoccus intestinalis]